MPVVTGIKEGYFVAVDLRKNKALMFKSGYIGCADLIAAPKDVLEKIMENKDNPLPIIPVTDKMVEGIVNWTSVSIRYVNSVEEYEKL